MAVGGAFSGIDFSPTACAICGQIGEYTQLYPAQVSLDDLNPDTFTARRHAAHDSGPPHYGIVRCDRCGLVRSHPTASTKILDRLYRASDLIYSSETANLRYTYGKHLRLVRKHGTVNEAFLEVGCGDGFLLEEAIRFGFRDVAGLEPSAAALSHANPEIRPKIRAEMLRPGLFPVESFDVIALFQTFDHIPDPAAALDEFHRLLRPNGRVLFLQHNVRALSARILGERSPIIDIGHTYLYDPSTLSALVRLHGFEPVERGIVWNRYSLRYLASLLPLAPLWKQRLRSLLNKLRLDRINISVPLGNMYLIARKLE